ncbi:hypothetical protein CesoFtcFv8_006638 [Champsocephalus esox]|uniref:Transcobalamin-like C-terminal domain-containing protein n=1 Tax=Champsocephalus esox TaxID=159716 RepID=A0AAN8CK10_9TELE|nr:hypothetical protein CesoFtcFv8_006638 [Champsocephalus esox]
MNRAFFSVALLLLVLLPGAPAREDSPEYCVTPFSILVSNSVTNAPNKTYSTCVVYRGILLEGMRRLQKTNKGFRFTYTEDPTYGPYLQSVNGLKGNTKDRTYWELLVKQANETIRLNVGIGAFIPSENDQIILNFKEY